MLNTYCTCGVRSNFFEFATCGVLVRVSYAITVDLMQRVILYTNVSASVSDSGVLIDHNLILGIGSEAC